MMCRCECYSLLGRVVAPPNLAKFYKGVVDDLEKTFFFYNNSVIKDKEYMYIAIG